MFCKTVRSKPEHLRVTVDEDGEGKEDLEDNAEKPGVDQDEDKVFPV